jgi:predicted dehydrogenase
MVRRFSRSARFLRALLRGRGSSPVRRVTWHEGTVFRWPIVSTDYFTRDPGTRLLWDMGSHVLDLLVWWLGAPDSLTCRDDAMGGVEANCLLEFEYRDGPRGHIRLSRDCELGEALVVERADDVVRCPDVYGDELAWAPRNAPGVVTGRIEGGGGWSPAAGEPAGPVGFMDCFVAQLENVLDAVRGAADLRVPARDVVDGIRILAAADANRAPLELPWLSPRERERAQALHASGVGATA